MPWGLLAALIRFTVRIENKNAEWKDLKKKKKRTIWSEEEHVKSCEQGGERMVAKDICMIPKK